MANEINESYSLTAVPIGASVSIAGSAATTMVATNVISSTTTFPTSATDTIIPFGSCAKGGILAIKNLESGAGQILDIATATGGSFAAAKIFSVGPGKVRSIETIVGVSYYARSRDAALTVRAQTTITDL